MKTIGIDARLLRQTGVGVYIQNLLTNLSQIASRDATFVIFARSEDRDKIPDSLNFIVKTSDFKWHSMAEQTGFYSQLMKEKLDLMHFTYFSYPVRYKKNFVITIHDLIPLHFRTGQASTHNPFMYTLKHEAYKYVIRSAVRNSSAIITPTLAVKNDIMQTFGEKVGEKIEVTYEGVRGEILTIPEGNYFKEKLARPFFLYVGNFYPHKNVDRLLQAFSQFTDRYDIVLVGPSDFFAKKMNIGKGIKLFTNLATDDLVYLYKHAQALIHPSLAEGFGLPLLEASYFGLPVIASCLDVFTEILGNSYLKFDPEKTEDIAAKIAQYVQDKDSVKPPSKESLMERFSFKTMTRQTLAIYQKLL